MCTPERYTSHASSMGRPPHRVGAGLPAIDRRPGVGSSLVPISDAFKRIFLGRALRSERLGDTMLPKRIALPVFASDALSSPRSMGD